MTGVAMMMVKKLAKTVALRFAKALPQVHFGWPVGVVALQWNSRSGGFSRPRRTQSSENDNEDLIACLQRAPDGIRTSTCWAGVGRRGFEMRKQGKECKKQPEHASNPGNSHWSTTSGVSKAIYS
jgi:hypothetical protein